MSFQLLCKTKHFKCGFNRHVCPAVPLFCYTCVFPAISPLDCIRFPLKCPPGQVCLSSRAVGEKGEGSSSHWTTFKWIKTEKKNWERQQHAHSEMCRCGLFCVSQNWCFSWTFRRLPRGAVWEELHPALPVRSHGWEIHHGTQLHLHQRMLQHTPVQQSHNACYPLLDWHTTHTTHFILSLVNRKNIKATWKRINLTHMKQSCLFCPLMGWHCTQLPFNNCTNLC